MTFIYLFLLLGFATAATWFGGLYLSRSTEYLGRRFKIDESLAGMAILAVITNLPECAIATHAAISGHSELLVGNVLGGIATQMMVLALLDWRTNGALTTKAAHPALIWQSCGLIVILSVALVGMKVNSGDHPYFEFALLFGWLTIVALTYLKQKSQPHDPALVKTLPHAYKIFFGSSLVTFIGGLCLATSVEALAERLHADSMLMGATVLAFLTALPEISSALGAIRLRAYRLAVSDVIGGNLFMPALLYPVALILGQPVLARASGADVFFTGLAILITLVYTIGLSRRQRERTLGLDSVVALVIFGLGTILAFFLF